MKMKEREKKREGDIEKVVDVTAREISIQVEGYYTACAVVKQL